MINNNYMAFKSIDWRYGFHDQFSRMDSQQNKKRKQYKDMANEIKKRNEGFPIYQDENGVARVKTHKGTAPL